MLRKITGEDWAAFGEAYSRDLPQGTDGHTLFAEKLGVDREAAKELSFRMIHSNSAIKSSLDGAREYWIGIGEKKALKETHGK